MRRIAMGILLLAACGNHSGGTDTATDTGTDTDTDSGTDADTDSGTDADTDSGTEADAAPAVVDAAPALPDAVPPSPDAAPSLYAPTQYSSRSCQSFGGFGAVHRNSPAKVLGFIDDQDGLADLAEVAEVVILGTSDYSLGDRPVEALEDSGCCQRAGRVIITYDDFVAAANAGVAPDGFWGVQVNFRDRGGNITSAVCSGAAGWYLDADPI